uniref:Uncharacterized protein n=1 Tax=Knipowitschia caucasica TaxID=637954 RepID=A0AAV2MP20_KNICA
MIKEEIKPGFGRGTGGSSRLQPLRSHDHIHPSLCVEKQLPRSRICAQGAAHNHRSIKLQAEERRGGHRNTRRKPDTDTQGPTCKLRSNSSLFQPGFEPRTNHSATREHIRLRSVVRDFH